MNYSIRHSFFITLINLLQFLLLGLFFFLSSPDVKRKYKKNFFYSLKMGLKSYEIESWVDWKHDNEDKKKREKFYIFNENLLDKNKFQRDPPEKAIHYRHQLAILTLWSHESFLIFGFAWMWHSKYRSSPSFMSSLDNVEPSWIATKGGSDKIENIHHNVMPKVSAGREGRRNFLHGKCFMTFSLKLFAFKVAKLKTFYWNMKSSHGNLILHYERTALASFSPSRLTISIREAST